MDIFKHKGFREFAIKIGIMILIGAIILILISVFRSTELFKMYFDTPQTFDQGILNNKVTIINALIFGLTAFIITFYKKLKNIKAFKFQKHQYVFIFFTITFFILQYVLKYYMHKNMEFFLQSIILWAIIKMTIIVLLIISLYFSIFGIQFTKYVLYKYKNELVLSSIITIAFFILMIIVQNLWTYSSGLTSHMLYVLFSLFFSKVTYIPFNPSFTSESFGGPLLGINNFNAIIGSPCSGIDSLLLFTSVFLLIYILDHKKMDKLKTSIAFIIGLIGMFFVNLLRIFLLFIVGAYIDPKLAIGLFHTNIGWILFIIYGLLFYYISFKFIYKKKKKIN